MVRRAERGRATVAMVVMVIAVNVENDVALGGHVCRAVLKHSWVAGATRPRGCGMMSKETESGKMETQWLAGRVCDGFQLYRGRLGRAVKWLEFNSPAFTILFWECKMVVKGL